MTRRIQEVGTVVGVLTPCHTARPCMPHWWPTLPQHTHCLSFYELSLPAPPRSKTDRHQGQSGGEVGLGVRMSVCLCNIKCMCVYVYLMLKCMLF